jgi:hypothetical protein
MVTQACEVSIVGNTLLGTRETVKKRVIGRNGALGHESRAGRRYLEHRRIGIYEDIPIRPAVVLLEKTMPVNTGALQHCMVRQFVDDVQVEHISL